MGAYISLKFQMKAEQLSRLIFFIEKLDDAYLTDYAERHANDHQS